MPTRVFALLATLVAGAPNPSSLLPQQLDDASDDIGWQFTRRRAPSADAEVAACVVGQARPNLPGGAEEVSQQRAGSAARRQLRGAQLYLSSRVEYNGRVEPVNLTQSQVEDRLPAAAAYLDPVSSVLTDDDSLATAAPEAWRHCFNGTAPRRRGRRAAHTHRSPTAGEGASHDDPRRGGRALHGVSDSLPHASRRHPSASLAPLRDSMRGRRDQRWREAGPRSTGTLRRS